MFVSNEWGGLERTVFKEKLKRGLFYFFRRDVEFENAYTKLLRFSALQLIFAIAYPSSIVSHGIHSSWGDNPFFGFISVAGVIMLLVAFVNWKVTKNYQSCCSNQQEEKNKLLLIEAMLSFSTLPFCLFTKPLFFWRHYKNKEK
ncbi:hypothetical protein DNK47_03180 [Mycoplasma wenyonii]|uniref:Uncharacterized protein n=1 Tax=Mycoplasma wenyonii TaxID=65123 RepID=A0A328PSR1_9MOLU|nr:hypothetical protein [Mycoplasma wenyonii]RAO94780.1 hypothetical protein DNK47_03180 [Mycoplasma wenyonii]